MLRIFKLVKDFPNYIFGSMGYEKGPIDKDLRPTLDLWGPIKKKLTLDSFEPLVFVEYDINASCLFFGIYHGKII
jgi:hypothetical protein